MRLLPASLFLLVLAGLSVLAPAGAAEFTLDEPQAQLIGSMSFGPGHQTPGYSLTLGYRTGDPAFAPMKIVELNVAGAFTQARLLGLPFHDSRYALGQSERGRGGDLVFDWRWVWWGVSGVAAAALIIDAAGDDDPTPSGTGAGG